MKKHFDTIAVFLDMSHNAVMNVPALCEYITLSKKMGYNAVMLYMEDTYTIEGEPYFGYLRGRYTEEELKYVDDFAYALGIEIIPAIQTLGHLGSLGRWKSKFPMDTDTVLLVGEERTYELIDKMLATLSRVFRTRRINIGMDEAFDLGRGKYLDKNGYEPVYSIMEKHLARVVEIGKKYNYEMQMWSDMFFRSWNDGKYYIPKCEIPKEVRDSLPDNVVPVYWDYSHWKKEDYTDMLANHRQLSDKTWFAGASWGWNGFTPINDYSIATSRAAIDACVETGVRNIVITTWGDNGSECSRYSLLPSLHFTAQYARGVRDMELIKTRFKRIFGVSFDDFMLIDTPERIAYQEEGREELEYNYANAVNWRRNPSKYMFYSDPFMGIHDPTVRLGEGIKYKGYKEELTRVAKSTRKYGRIFLTLAALCDCMEIKYELGVKTRFAYKKGDKAELMRLAKEEYPTLVKRIAAFTDKFRAQWLYENKPFGLEVQEMRLGGLKERVSSCGKRLLDYAMGKVDTIPELEADIIGLSDGKGKSIQGYYHLDIITLNKVQNIT